MNKKEQLTSFFETLFSNTLGDVIVSGDNADGLCLEAFKTRDFGDIWGHTIHEAANGFNLWTIPITDLNEVVAVVGSKSSTKKFDMPKPSFVLKDDGHKFCFWLLKNPVDDTMLDVSKRVSNIQKKIGDNACPYPDPDFWTFNLPKKLKRYSVDELAKAVEVDEKIEDDSNNSTDSGDVSFVGKSDEKWNDATIYGNLDDKLLERSITIGMNSSANVRNDSWKNIDATAGALIESLTLHEEGKKDGRCILQGSTIGGVRRANAVDRLEIIMLDLDTGVTMGEMRRTLQDKGLFAVMWTTHSHGAEFTDVRKEAVIRHFKLEDEPTEQQVLSYLRDVKLYQDHIIKSASLEENLVHNEKGIHLRVTHKPIPKFRILCLLEKPFVIAERSHSQKEAIREWKERYLGFSKQLGAFADTSCVDPSRLMYTPRHNVGSPFAIDIIAGKPLDIETAPRVSSRNANRGSGPENNFTKQGKVDGSSGKHKFHTKGLAKFLAKHADQFNAADLMEHYDPDGYVQARENGPGHVHACPFEDQHTPPENGPDMGFFVVNGPESDHTGSFVMHCSHTCPDDRAVLLDEFCRNHNLKVKDLREFVDDNLIKNDDGGNENVEDSGKSETDSSDKKRSSRLPPKILSPYDFTIKSIEDENGKKRSWVFLNMPDKDADDDDDGAFVAVKQFIPLEQVAQLRDWEDGSVLHQWRFKDKNGQDVTVEIPAESSVMKGGSEFIGELHRKGFLSTEKGRKILMKWGSEIQPSRDIHQVRHPGWYEDMFMTPLGEALNNQGREYLLNTKQELNDQTIRGTLKGWKKAIKTACRQGKGFDHFIAGAISGFAGPVIQFLDHDSYVLFYCGTSGRGKSTAQQLGASAWANPALDKGLFSGLRSTSNALEWMIAQGNGSYIGLDETQHMKQTSDELQQLIFAIASNSGKKRMTASGEARKSYAWKTLVTISGEITLMQQIEKGGGQMTQGASVRCFPLNMNGTPDLPPGVVPKILANGILSHFGHAGPYFVEKFIEAGHLDRRKEINQEILDLTEQIFDGTDPTGTDRRAARVVGLILWCGLFAQEIKLLPKDLDLIEFAKRIWRERSQAEEAAPSIDRAIENLKNNVISNIDVTVFEAGEKEHRNRTAEAYYVDGHMVYVPVSSLDKLCGRISAKADIQRELQKRGVLTPRKAGGRTILQHSSIPHEGRINHIRLDWDFFFASDDDENSEKEAA